MGDTQNRFKRINRPALEKKVFLQCAIIRKKLRRRKVSYINLQMKHVISFFLFVTQ